MRNLPIASPPSFSSFFPSSSIEVPAMTKPSSDLILFFFPVSSQSHSKDVTIDGRKEKSKSGRNGEKKREEEEEEEKKQIPRFFRFAQNAETFFPTGAQSLFSSVPMGGGGGEGKSANAKVAELITYCGNFRFSFFFTKMENRSQDREHRYFLPAHV